MPETPGLAPFDTKGQYFYPELPLDIQTLNPISKAEPGYPTKDIHFSRFYSISRNLGSLPKALEGWNIERQRDS